MSAASDAEPIAEPARAARTTWAQPRARGLVLSAALAVFLLLSVLLGLSVGRGTTHDESVRAVFVGMRAYRVGVAFFAGASLAVGGAIVQGLFRNPLASPQILGTSAGALLGGKLALMATFALLGGRALRGLSPEMLVPLGCVVGAVLSLGAVLSVSSLHAGTVTLLLSGCVLSGLLASAGTFLSSLAQESFELSRAMSSFGMGSLSGAGPKQLLLAGLLATAGTLPTLLSARSLDVLLSGEEEARALGVEVSRVRLWCVAWASLVTAGAVAVGGGVGLIGLIAPHAVRRLTGPRHRVLIPAAFVTGGAFLVLCDALCRAIPLEQEVPLSVVTELLGAPAFLWMLRRREHEARHG